MGNLSPHFDLENFFPVTIIRKINPTQRKMIELLVLSILEPIRIFIDTPMVILSGARDYSEYERLIADGYKPKNNSDHFFGLVKNTVGACDWYTPQKNTNEIFFELLKKYNRTTKKLELPNATVNFGQIILEHRKGYWIHISNPRLVFGVPEISNTNKILQSTDNGGTYKAVTL
jgi:hypothetical protein